MYINARVYFPFCVIGAIEISILCKHYQIEIDVVNTESGRIDRFGKFHQCTRETKSEEQCVHNSRASLRNKNCIDILMEFGFI